MNENGENQKNKQPKFNFNWLYIMLIVGLIFMIFTRHDGKSTKTIDYSTFKEYVNKGYAGDVVINKDELTLEMFIDGRYDRIVFGNGNKKGVSRAVKVEFGSIDKVEDFLEEQKKRDIFQVKLNMKLRMTCSLILYGRLHHC